MNPIIKWAGGKRKFAEQISPYLGEISGTYYEPFLGGAAMLLSSLPKHAICSDINPELINFYEVVKDNANDLISELRNEYLPNHCKEFFYKIRGLDRDLKSFNRLSPTSRAARFLYLNKTCYNGLWRVNRKGQNNVPFGRYKNPTILNEDEIRQVHNYLKNNDVTFSLCDYSQSVASASQGDVVYFDPPYDVENGQSDFVGYTADGFTQADQKSLKSICDKLLKRGAKVVVSNSNTCFINHLYGSDTNYEVIVLKPFSRTIGQTIQSRKITTEVLIVGKQ